MNYLTEIKMFYDWLETHKLSDSAVAMWHGLMFIANRAGWQENLTVSMEALRLRTQIPRTSIYRVREQLEDAGLIKVIQQGGRNCPVYIIRSFESQLESHIGTQDENRKEVELQEESHGGTQSENREGFESHSGTQTANINKTKQDVNVNQKKQGKKKKVSEVDEWVAMLESPWQELMRIWFEYKKSRKETYATVIGAKSCLTKLRNLSGGNPQTAQAIIENSMANNWAGLFQLSGQSSRGHPATPATGQRIGQIMQPDSEEHRNAILEKFKHGVSNPKQ